MIICGFPGTGKTMMAMQSTWVDLESTPFEKDFDLYAKVAKHMSDNGYTVMVSTHKEMLDCLEKLKTPYTVIIPALSDRKKYRSRYSARGNHTEFIERITENWYSWIEDIIEQPSELKTVVILPKDGCIAHWRV